MPDPAPVGGSTFCYGAQVRANSIRQHYLRYGGEGPALVLVPGIISPAVLWGLVAERLGRHFDTYVLDVRGRGLSEAGAHLDYGLNACADDLIAFVQALGLQATTVLGHSMGARIALRATRRAEGAFDHPAGAFGHLVLADPPVSGPGRRAYPTPLEGMLDLLRAAQRGEAEAALRKPGMPVWPDALLRLRAEWLHTCDERAATEAHRSFHADDIHADIAQLSIPAALIMAGKGGVIRPEDEAEIRGLAPAIEMRRIANAGHQMQVDDPESFFAALGAVLGKSL